MDTKKDMLFFKFEDNFYFKALSLEITEVTPCTCVCVSVSRTYMHAYVYIYVSVRVCERMQVSDYVCLCMRVYDCANVRVRSYMYTTYVHVWLCICTFMCA